MAMETVMDQRMYVEVEGLVDLNVLSAGVYYGCMGLPQELVDQVMDVLYDDLQTLRACSLTCRAMFASTRRLIHQTLHLTRREYHEGYILLGSEPENIAGLNFVSYVAECDLLRYTRRIHIHDSCNFTPGTMLPHLHHFQSLDRVHALTIEGYHAITWANHHNPLFTHLRHTLTSLTLSHPFGHCQLVVQFVLQFPNLENLCLEQPRGQHIGQYVVIPVIIDQFPPLRGHLRLVGPEAGLVGLRLIEFTRELGKEINFRSVEIEDCLCPPRILNDCASTIEDLIIAPDWFGTRRRLPLLLAAKWLTSVLPTGYDQLRDFNFRDIAGLRRLTLRTAFTPDYGLAFSFTPISTITSPVFREFVLEVDGIPSNCDGTNMRPWGRWGETDTLIAERVVKDGDFRFTIRTGKLHRPERFRMQARWFFPLAARSGCIHFETS